MKAITQFYDDDIWAAYLPQNQNYFGIRGKKGSYFQPKTELERIERAFIAELEYLSGIDE